MKAKLNHLPEIDALRGLAAVAVVFCHITLNRPQGEHFFKYGFTGVDLFFIISGFVISMSLTHIKNGKEFILRRATRLYPAYWVAVTLIGSLLVPTGIEHANKAYVIKYLCNLTMFQPYLGQGHIDDSYWTLIVEMQFYLFMLIVYRLGKFKYVEGISVGVLVLLIGCAGFLNYHQLSVEHLFIIYRYFAIIICFPLFFAGIIYYKLMFEEKTIARYGMLALCFITQLCFMQIDPRLKMAAPYKYYLIVSVFNGLFLLLIHGKLKFHINKVTLFLGKISYPLYLINTLISVKMLIPFLTLYMGFWLAAAIDLVLLIGLSYLITRFVEKPAQLYVRKKWLAR